MKKILTLFAMLLVTVSTLLAQTSDQHPKLSYQMVVRNNCAADQAPVQLGGVTFKYNDLVFDQDVNGVAKIMVGTEERASAAFTAHTNYNGMMSLTLVDKTGPTGKNIVKFTTLNSLRDVDWSKAKIVIQMDGNNSTTALCINNVMEVLPVPYALSASNQDSLLSTLAITNYIDDAKVDDVKQIIASIWANQNNISKTFDSLVVFYIKNNPTAVKNLGLYFLGTVDSADVADAYKAFNENETLSQAVIDTIVNYAKNHYDQAKEILLYYISTADMDDVEAVLTAIDNMNSQQVEDIVDTLLTVSAKYLSAHKDLVWKAAKKMMDEVITTNDLDMAYQYLKGEYNGKTTNTELFTTIESTIDALIQKHLDDSLYLRKCVVCNDDRTQCDTIDICELLARLKNLENNPNFVKCPNLGKPTHVRDLNATDSTYAITTKISNIPSALNLTVGSDSILFLVTYPNSLYTKVDTLYATITKGTADTTMSATYVHNDNNKTKGEVIVLQAMLKTKCTPLSAQFSEYDTIKLPMECLKVVALENTDPQYSVALMNNKGIKLTGTLDRYYPEMIANDSIGFIVDYIDYDGTTVKHDTLFADSLPTKLVVKDNKFTATIDMTYCSKDVTVHGFVKCSTDHQFYVSQVEKKFHVRGPELHIISPNADSTYAAFADSLVLSDTSLFHTDTYGDHQIEWYIQKYPEDATSNGITNPNYFWKLKYGTQTIGTGREYKIAPDSTTNYVAWMEMAYMGKTCKIYDTIRIKYKPYECSDSIAIQGDTLLGPTVKASSDHVANTCFGTKDSITVSATSFMVKKNTTDTTWLKNVVKNAADHNTFYNGLVDSIGYAWFDTTLTHKLAEGETYKLSLNRDSVVVCALSVKYNNDTVCVKYDTIRMTYMFQCGDSITDLNSNKYGTIQLGRNCWTRSNMRAEVDSLNTPIPLGEVTTGTDVTSDSARYATSTNLSSQYRDIKKVGYLYNRQAALRVCPKGWTLPSDEDWCDLEKYAADSVAYVDGYPVDVDCTRDSLWSDHQEAFRLATNKDNAWYAYNGYINPIGFDAYPAGFRDLRVTRPDATITLVPTAIFWTSTKTEDGSVNKYWYRMMSNEDPDYTHAGVMRESVKKDVYGFSVRCIKKGYEVPTCPITLGATTMEPSTTATQVSGYTISTVVNNSDEMAGITGQYVLCNKDGQPITLGSTTQAASISYAATVVDGKLQAFIPEDDITEYKNQMLSHLPSTFTSGSIILYVRPSLTFPSECFGRTSVKGSVANIYEVVMDADHNFYPVAKIGDQTWMTQNLMTSKTADGTALSQDDYESNPSDPQQYPNAGYLYRTYVPGLTQSICPNGWTVPSIADYQTLNSVDPTYAAFNHIYCMYYDGSAWLGHNQYYITSNLYQSEEYYCVNIEHVTPGYFANFSYGKIPLRCIKANN